MNRSGADRTKASRLRRKGAPNWDKSETEWMKEYLGASDNEFADNRRMRSAYKPPSMSVPAVVPPVREPEQMTLPDVHVTVETPMISDAGNVPLELPAVPTVSAGQAVESDVQNDVPGASVAALPPLRDAGVQAASAAKIAAVITLLLTAGLDACEELRTRKVLTAEIAAVAAIVTNPETRKVAIEHVAACAVRVSEKYGVSATVPYEDELTVGAAALASVLAIVARQKLAALPPSQTSAEIGPAPVAKGNTVNDGWGELLG